MCFIHPFCKQDVLLFLFSYDRVYMIKKDILLVHCISFLVYCYGKIPWQKVILRNRFYFGLHFKSIDYLGGELMATKMREPVTMHLQPKTRWILVLNELIFNSFQYQSPKNRATHFKAEISNLNWHSQEKGKRIKLAGENGGTIEGNWRMRKRG